MRAALHLLAFACALLPLAGVEAATEHMSARDSIRIGTSGVLCTAQSRPTDAVLTGMFDRGYEIVCRDAAASVGRLYALRSGEADALARLVAARGADIKCAAPVDTPLEHLGAVTLVACSTGGKIRYQIYSLTRGPTVYVAEGLAGYESALRLGLQMLVADRPVTGAVEVATTAAGDPAAFARVQAGSLDADQAFNEGYLRNNLGSYAEASAFFSTLIDEGKTGGGARGAELLANKALQESNLGHAAEADALFARALAMPQARDGVTARLIRNFRAIHALNRGLSTEALAVLAVPIPPLAADASAHDDLSRGRISAGLANQLSREDTTQSSISGVDNRLSPAERGAILDAQALSLKGTALRIANDRSGAAVAFDSSERALLAVRGGRIATVAGLRADLAAERAALAEQAGDLGAAERGLELAVRIVGQEYPQSPALLTGQARLAAFYARHDKTELALGLYRDVIAATEDQPAAAAAMTKLLEPYFALLETRGRTDPAALADLFVAAQALVRPGVAQTQAVLARELSAGGDEAADLFRQSLALSRDVVRMGGEVASLSAATQKTPEDEARLADAKARLTIFQRQQTAVQSELGAFPRYRVIASSHLALADMQKLLRDDEAYYKLIVLRQTVYALYVTRADAVAWVLPLSTRQLGDVVDQLRESISIVVDGRQESHPFDLVAARRLYVAMFAPVAARIGGVKHLIYEPDGPLLQLPANLLVVDQAGVDAYLKRAETGDPFDFTGVAWLGRGRGISTSVSSRAFADIRAIAPSAAPKSYIGFGRNAPPPNAIVYASLTRTGTAGIDCDWALSSWSHPISAAELEEAKSLTGGTGELMTGEQFSDTGLLARTDLSSYRILHFATHGLVTAPHPGCPARPALLTSFGAAGSDGLLSFREIYELRLDADVVILSACDTAGAASVSATREAGVETGGDYALDGLVRAFVGAGARTVIASHWPLPDQFDATQRLIEGLFRQAPDTPIDQAMERAEQVLMDSPETSHPYYWSAFAIVGDGTRPLVHR